MAATPSVKIVKSFNYKSGAHLWSNRYHFVGGTPADDAHWHTFMDNIVAAEKAIYAAVCTIVSAVGYAAGSDVPVSSKTYSTAGTFNATGLSRLAGNDAALLRYSTDIRTAKNHPVYLFNYFHSVHWSGSGTSDVLASSQKTAIETYAAAWIAGFSDGTNTLHRAGPNGAVALAGSCNQYVTHRDFRT